MTAVTLNLAMGTNNVAGKLCPCAGCAGKSMMHSCDAMLCMCEQVCVGIPIKTVGSMLCCHIKIRLVLLGSRQLVCCRVR